MKREVTCHACNDTRRVDTELGRIRCPMCATPDQQRRRETGVCPKCDGENIWLLVYEDQGMEPVLFSNHGADEAARKAFEHAATKWTVRLFKCVAQDGYGPGTGQQPAQPGKCLAESARGQSMPRCAKYPQCICGGPEGWTAQPESGEAVQWSDDFLRTMWRSQGGSFHGPNVETGTMPEAKLLPFMRMWLVEIAAKNVALTAAQQRIAALHAALRTYGWHRPECDYMQEELPCTCGFMDAVKEPS